MDDIELKSLSELAAMEMTTAEFMTFIEGRREIYDTFYARVVKGLKANDARLFRFISSYRDRYSDILSNPYPLNYMLFVPSDMKVAYEVTGISEAELDEKIKELKKFIKENAKNTKAYKEAGVTPDFQNVTSFRVLLILIIKYYMDTKQKDKVRECCAYLAYSLYYSVFTNAFRTPPRKETMAYTVETMTNKFKLKQCNNMDELMTYSIEKLTTTYPDMFRDCTDHDIIYLIGQAKSRLRGFMMKIREAYKKNDIAKNAMFQGSEFVDDDEGSSIIERKSASGDIITMARNYTTKFFQNEVNQDIAMIASKLCTVSRNELRSALDILRRDTKRIQEVTTFYECLFSLYTKAGNSLNTASSTKFLAEMEAIYKKGNSIDENITTVKKLIDSWLEATSSVYRATNRQATLNNFRKAIYTYFVYTVGLRGLGE